MKHTDKNCEYVQPAFTSERFFYSYKNEFFFNIFFFFLLKLINSFLLANLAAHVKHDENYTFLCQYVSFLVNI